MKRRQRKKNNIQKAQAYKDVLINKGFTTSNGFSVAPFRSLNGVDYGVYISNPKGMRTFNKRYFKEVSA